MELILEDIKKVKFNLVDGILTMDLTTVSDLVKPHFINRKRGIDKALTEQKKELQVKELGFSNYEEYLKIKDKYFSILEIQESKESEFMDEITSKENKKFIDRYKEKLEINIDLSNEIVEYDDIDWIKFTLLKTLSL